jgi:2-iminobutanoate/2-iminopropanoate deaminase
VREVVVSGSVPAPHAPSYSHAVRSGPFIFCTGQMGELPDGSLEAGAHAQATRALANLDGVLAEWATSLDEAIKITVFLVDWDRDYPEIKRALDERLTGSRPARSTVEIRKLAMGGLVEIEAIVAAPAPD